MKEFQDIFSKRKERPMIEKPKEKIIIDYREKNSLVPAILTRLGFETELIELKVADYLVKGVAIERKTVEDFWGSIINKRLVRQLEELQQYEKKLLIIEGIDEKDIYSRINENAIRGFILSVLLKHNVPIIFSKNAEDTAKYIAVLANKQENIDSINPSKKILNKKDRAKYILESFEGIGPKKAELLLDELKSLRNIFSASKDILEERLGKNTLDILDEKF